MTVTAAREDPSIRPSALGPPPSPASHLERALPAVLAAVAYVPLLLTHPGMVGADTKQYLYLDPSRLLARAPSMWDPNVGMGTVTHQNIGYLLPMGPWYWTLHALHVPTWVAQRLWIGSLLFLAGLGVVFLLRTLGWRSPERSHTAAVLVGALAFMLSPYVLEYEARISAILMPWAALPWMVALVARALRSRSWRHPALFAVVVALCGGVNATSLIYAGIAPVLWFPFAVWGSREVPLRSAVVTFVRTGVLTTICSLWWIAGLATQAGYGLDVLRYTETVQTVAQTGLPIETLRGLGNWYFYGRDAIGPWVQPASEYTQQLWRLAISYLLPILAVVAAVATRWRHKLYFVSLIVIGMALAVGVHPYAHPSPLGDAFKAFANSSSAGLALRSVGRAVPLIALGTAVLLGSGVDALWARWAGRPRRPSSRLALSPLTLPWLAAALCIGLILANMAPLFTGQFVDNNLQRPNDIPAYWTQAASYLDQRGDSTRVLELPGADFSHYRWGATLDPVTPGLMDRPFVSRELIPYGSAASADLIRALDRRLQEGVFEPQSLAPLARLMSAGDVVLRSDLQYERFSTPRPQPTWLIFDPSPAGLAKPVTFGPSVAGTPVVPLLDETALATPPSAPDPPAVSVFGVSGALPIVRTAPAERPVVVAGDGEGLVDMAAAGLLDDRGAGAAPVLYSAALAGDPAAMQTALGDGADLVLTDTNRRRGQRWGTIRNNNGYTEAAGEQPLVTDPTDARLPLFPGATDDSFTVAIQHGVAAVRATTFGNPVSYAPGERPDLALDGDPTTAWKAGAFSDVNGDRLRIDLQSPVTTDHLTLVQPLVAARERYITKATVTFDGGSALPVDLTGASRTVAGQTVRFPTRTFHRVDITVDAMNFGRRADYRGGSPVGFSEVRIPGVHADESVRLPVDLLDAAGAGSISHRLTILLTRMRSDPLASFETDEEAALDRTFTLPTARTFSLEGTARLSTADAADEGPAGSPPVNPLVPTAKIDDALDADLGRPAPAQGGIVARSSERMPGDLLARAESAFDGDPATAWTTAFGDQVGKWIEVTTPHPVSFDHFDLTVFADGRHSVPSQLRISVPGQADQDVAVPAIADGHQQNHPATVRVALPHPVSGSTVRVTVLAVRAERTINYLSATPQTLPVAIAELGIPGVLQPRQAGELPEPCRTDLLAVDGKPVGVRILGSRHDAELQNPLQVQLCAGPATSLTLPAGTHRLQAAPGRTTGVNLDRLVLASERGGGPLAGPAPLGAAGAPTGALGAAAGAGGGAGPGSAPAATAPKVRIVHQGRTAMTLSVTMPADGRPFWLVLGESHNAGWTARLTGPGGHSLGPPVLVDGYANGWLIQPARGAGPGATTRTIKLDWTPQHRVVLALWLSALGLLACLALALWPRNLWWRAGPDLAERASNLPALPRLDSPLRPAGRPLTRSVAMTVVAVGAVGAGFVIGPLEGVLVGAILAAVMARPKWRALLTVGAVGLLSLSALYVVQLQLRYHFPTKIEWPDHFSRVALVPWVAIALLAADAVIDHLRARRRLPAERPLL